MKNILKYIAVPSLAALVLSACAAKEKLDLASYPEIEMELNISDLATATPQLELTAQYNSTGDLALDGVLTHNYLIKLTKASPQDLMLRLEPIAVNIPMEKVTLNQTEYTIPAGEVELPIIVTFTDADFNFAAPNKDAQTYEIGVRVVDVKGVSDAAKMIGTEAKVVVNKEVYSANVSVADVEGRTKDFTRSTWDGAIYETNPMTFDFKVYLDRPASADINVTFSLESLAAEFADDWSVTPSTVVIPTGSVISETVTFSLNNDFLTATTGAEDYALTLKADYESVDTYTSLAEDKESIIINIAKKIDALKVVSPNKPATWPSKLSSSEWTVDPTNLFDGSTTSYTTLSANATRSVTADMKDVKLLNGFFIRPYNNSAAYNCQTVEVFISDDEVTYTSIGKKTVTTMPTGHVFELWAAVSTRYLKFDLLRTTSGTCRIAEIEIY
jgi:hypothetical protein